MVLLLDYSPSMEKTGLLERENTFAVIGVSIADNFQVEMLKDIIGTSILKNLNRII